MENGSARRIVAVVLITTAVSGAFVAGRLARADGNPSWFAFAGDKFVNAAQAPPSLYIRHNSYGFDGVGFYRISLEPFTNKKTGYGITFDLPAFRLQRIVYPLLVRAVTDKDPKAVAWGLIAWNLAGMVGLGLLGALLARDSGRDPIWGLTLSLLPPFALSLGLDTAEIIAGVFLLSGLLFLRRRRYVWASAALTVAALTRETTLVVSIAGVLVWLWNRVRHSEKKDTAPPWTFLVPMIVQGAWEIVLWARWGKIPLSQAKLVDQGAPFLGFYRAVRDALRFKTALNVFHLVLLITIVFFTVMVARELRHSLSPLHERVAWVFTAVAMPFYSGGIWFHHWGYMRALSEFLVLGVLIVLGSKRAATHRLWFWVVVWASIAIQLALYP